MGLSIALYRRSLLSSDSVDLLPGTQCICFAFSLNCFLLDFICFAHVRIINLKVFGTKRSWPVLG
jgi:hypothetical protein